jgi:beta-lactam-binding protein with PASTA domain
MASSFLTAIAALTFVLPTAASAQIISVISNPATGAPITYQPTNMEGATITAAGGQCTGCVIANIPASAVGTYGLSLSAFGMIPVTFLPNTSPLPAQVYSEVFEGDCFTLSLGNAVGTLLGGDCQNFTIFAQPGTSNAVFQFQFNSASSHFTTLTGTTYLILIGTTASPVTVTTTPLCTGTNPPPGCAPFPSDITTSFNAITLDWYGYVSTTPYAPPPPGSNTVTVFDVAGFSQSVATNLVTGEGLTTSIEFVSSSSVPEGDVISQTPSALSSAPSGSTVTLYVSSGPPSITDQIPNLSYLTAVNTNPADPSLYVVVSRGNYTEGGPFNDVVLYSSLDDTVVANIPLTGAAASNSPSNIAVDSVNNVIYVASTNGSSVGTVTVIDALTHTINATLTVGRAPTGLAIDPSLNLAYVSNSDDTFISVIQGPTRANSGAITAPAKVAASIGGILPLGAIAVDANNNPAVDPYSHTVYAVIDGPAPLGEANYTLAVITGSVAGGYAVNQVSYLDNAGFTDIGTNALAVDQKSGKVVIADTEDQVVRIYNPNGGGFQDFYESFYPDSVAIDSTHELAYVSSGYGNVVQINLASGAQTTVSGASAVNCGYSGTAVAVDPALNVAYFTSCDGTAGLGLNGSSINSWNGAANTLNWSSALGSPIGNDNSVGGSFGITVNPASHVAYVSSSTTIIPATANTAAVAGAIDVINGPAPGTSPQFTLSVSNIASPVTTQALDFPAAVTFGNVAIGTTSPPAVFNITNASTSTTAMLPVVLGTAFAPNGDNCIGLQMPSGGSCTAYVVFAPTTSATYPGGVAFLDNERDTPQLIGLSGKGTGTYTLSISPSTIPEGYVGLPYAPTSYPVYFSSVNASGLASFNICATVGGQPSTNPADCCPPSSSYELGPGTCPAGLLPPGMNFSYGNLSAASNELSAVGSYPFSVIATDTNGDSGFQNYTLVIGPAFTTTLSLSSNTVIGSQSVTATVTLNQPAPAGGAVIFIDSSNTSAVPSTVVEVPAGALSATMTVATNGVSAVTPVGLYPYYSVPGATVSLTVEPPGGPPPPPPPTTTVPNVVGDTQAVATAAITGAGLTVGTVTTASNSTVAAGVVISQGTAAGTVENDGFAISLVVSSGPPTTVGLSFGGEKRTAATAAITGAGLTVGTVTTASNSTVAAGLVISQGIAAGTVENDGFAINLVISSGPPTTTVPNVVGDTQAVATTLITNAGLKVGTVTNASNSTVAAGVVISQSPALGGPAVADGSAVNLTVSSGPPTTTVPNVVGDTQAVATTAITGAGLKVGTVTTVSNSTVAAGVVISQSPAPGGPAVADGSAVNLTVSSGPPTTTVPNVVGDTQAVATTLITNAGLKVGTVTNASNSTVAAGVVISQGTAAGTVESDGFAISLVVSSGPPTTTVPNVVGNTQTAATAAITGAGLTVGTVTTASNSTVAAGLVTGQSPAAGTSESDGAAVSLVVSSGPAAPPTIILGFDGTPVVNRTPTGWTISVTLQNAGNVTAQTVQETTATLNEVAQLAASEPFTLAAGATGSIVLTFPASAGTAGSSVRFTVSGTYSATALSGTWAASLRALALP